MIEKNVIKKGPPKRDPVCFEVLQDIVIPKGTILRQIDKNGEFMCLANGGKFIIDYEAAFMRISYKRVIAA